VLFVRIEIFGYLMSSLGRRGRVASPILAEIRGAFRVCKRKVNQANWRVPGTVEGNTTRQSETKTTTVAGGRKECCAREKMRPEGVTVNASLIPRVEKPLAQ